MPIAQRGLTLRGPHSSSFWVPWNLSHHTHTGDTKKILKSYYHWGLEKCEFSTSFTVCQKLVTNNIFCTIFVQLRVFQQIIFKKVITSLGFISFITEFNLNLWMQIRKNSLLFRKTFLIIIFKNTVRRLFCWWIPSSCKKHHALIRTLCTAVAKFIVPDWGI
jgi:hypothetical protein